MRTNWINLVACAAALACLSSASEAQTRKSRGETGLVGVKLYDTGMRLLQIYGNPDEILPIGAAVGRGTGRRPSGGGGGGAGAGADNPRSGDISLGLASPFGFGDEMMKQQYGALMDLDPTQEEIRQGTSKGGGGGAQMGDGGDTPPARGGGGGGGARRAVPQTSNFMRWVYRRNGSQYGFILDHQNRVVQIEAIGIQNAKVVTKKGVGFGDTFKEVMNKYQLPEGYQIAGDSIVMRYLVKDKVAFRLNRLGEDKPHVVTAIVVAAGKT